MDLGVPSALKRAMAVRGIAETLARAAAVSVVPPTGSESDRYRRRRTGAQPLPLSAHVTLSRDQAPAAVADHVVSDDLNINEQQQSSEEQDSGRMTFTIQFYVEHHLWGVCQVSLECFIQISHHQM